jgi:Domain of unknown function (DUF3943)
MYFCSARANGYDYWESTAFAFAGSFMWEYFGETHNASINDLVSTGYGGVAFGEMLHRFSEKILDDEATGSGRNWRELGGLIVNPMGGINRMITGEFTRIGPNPPGRGSEAFRANWRFGSRFTGEGTLTNADTVRAFMRLRGLYGDQAGGEIKKPFDAFSFDLQFNFQDAAVLGRAQVQGILRSWELSHSDRTSWYFAAVNHYDYVNNWAYVYGGQSVGAALLTRVKSQEWTMDAGLTATWIILGGTSSDYASYTGRTYDYGPGAGGKFFAVLRRHGQNILGLESDLYYLRIMNGTDANHVVRESRLTVGLPVRGPFGFGAEFSMYNAERRYADYPDMNTRAPQATVYLSWML